MSFQEVKLEWEGKQYVIPPERLLGAIARIEDVITLEELSRYMLKDSAPRARLSQAFGAVLRYAGARVTDEEIYEGMFGDPSSRIGAVVTATTALLGMMLPPGSAGGAADENPPQPRRKRQRGS